MNGVAPGSRCPSGVEARASNIASALAAGASASSSIQRSRHDGARPSSRARPRSSSPVISPRGAMRGSSKRKIGACAAAASRVMTSGASSGAQLDRSRGPPEPAGCVIDVIELAPIDRREQLARGVVDGIEAVRCRLGDRRPEGLELLGDGGDLPARLIPLCGFDEREQRGAGDELERGVEHEGVGGIGPRGRRGLCDLGDEAGVGRIAGGGEGVRHRHEGHPKSSSVLEVKGSCADTVSGDRPSENPQFGR